MTPVRVPVRRSGSARSKRRGLLTAWSAIALVAVGLCAIYAVNLGLISWTRTRAQDCADAAALAACRALLTDDLLLPDVSAGHVDDRIRRCRRQAMAVARLYRDSGRIPEVRPHHVHVWQRVHNADRNVWIPLTDSVRPDSVQVQVTNRSTPQDSSGRLAGAGLSGISRAIIDCRASAWICDRICGFQTGPDIAIPIAPLAIPQTDVGVLAGTWSAVAPPPDSPSGSTELSDTTADDRYSWDSETDSLSDHPDGLSELLLAVTRRTVEPAPGFLLPVELCPAAAGTTPFADRLRFGLTHEDTTAAGIRQLSFPRSDVAQAIGTDDFDALERVLTEIVGQKRIFPLVRLGRPGPNAELTSVVAARILAAERTGRDEIRVLLQPTVLSTASAVIRCDGSGTPSRYVRRITLLP